MDGPHRKGRFGALLATLIATLTCAFWLAPAAQAAPELPPKDQLLGLNDAMAPARYGLTTFDYVELVRAAGGNAARTVLDWRAAEPTPGEWDAAHWNAWRQFYDEAVFQGITPIFVIGFAPPWAREAKYQGCTVVGRCELPPSRSMDEAWARYAAEVAKRFPKAAIEIWNEPNLGIYWETDEGPDPVRFAELVEVASEAIREVSPQTKLISGGLGNLEVNDQRGISMRDYLERVLKIMPELPDVVDEVGIHVYGYSTDIGPGSLFHRSIEHARAALDEAGLPGAPLAVTETGVSRGAPESLTGEEQGETTMRIVRQLIKAPDISTAVLHRVIVPRETSALPWELGSGMVGYGSDPPQPYPVFCAMAAAAESAYPGCGGNLSLRVDVDFANGDRFLIDETLPVRTPNFRAMLACSYNGAQLVPCSMPLSIADLASGQHSLTVHAIDTKTWQLSPGVTRNFWVETQPPGDGDGSQPPDDQEQPPDEGNGSQGNGSQGNGSGRVPPGRNR